MLQSHIPDMESFKHFIKDFVSFQRLITPEEIGDFVFYASNTPILNGSVLHCNFGQQEK